MTNKLHDTPPQLRSVWLNENELIGVDNQEPPVLLPLLHNSTSDEITIVQIKHLILVDRIEDLTEGQQLLTFPLQIQHKFPHENEDVSCPLCSFLVTTGEAFEEVDTGERGHGGRKEQGGVHRDVLNIEGFRFHVVVLTFERVHEQILTWVKRTEDWLDHAIIIMDIFVHSHKVVV